MDRQTQTGRQRRGKTDTGKAQIHISKWIETDKQIQAQTSREI